MTINVLEAIEGNLAAKVPIILSKLIPLFGVNVEIRKTKDASEDKYAKVYGVNAASYEDPLPLVKVLLTA